MDCLICWDVFEESALNLDCGHHLDWLLSLAVHTNNIREVFFTSAANISNSPSKVNLLTSEPLDKADGKDVVVTLPRIRSQDNFLCADNLKGRQQLEAAMKQETLLRQEIEEMKVAAASAEKQIAELRAKHVKWKRHAKNLKQEVVDLECRLEELNEIKQERDDLKKIIHKMTKEASKATKAQLPAVQLETITSSRPPKLSDSDSSGSSICIQSRYSKATRPSAPLASTTPCHQHSEPNPPPTPPPVKPLSKATPASKSQIKTRKMQTGDAILWRGYGCPQKTAVMECTASDGYHNFSGKGTNQYKKRYTCRICHVVISEDPY